MLTISDDEARKNGPLVTKLAALLPGETETAHLATGDYVALDLPVSFGVERKAFGNLIASLGSDELDEQLARLVDAVDIPYLLVEGMPSPTPDGKLRLWGAKRAYPYGWVAGALLDWAARGVVVWRVDGIKETPYALAYLHRWWSKGEHRETYRPKAPTLPALRRVTFTEQVMLQFPGVGPKRVEAVRHTPLADLAGWTEEEWIALLGKAHGANVYKKWREPR